MSLIIAKKMFIRENTDQGRQYAYRLGCKINLNVRSKF